MHIPCLTKKCIAAIARGVIYWLNLDSIMCIGCERAPSPRGGSGASDCLEGYPVNGTPDRWWRHGAQTGILQRGTGKGNGGGHRGEKEKELWMESWGKVKGQPGSSVPTTWWRACTLCKRASSLTPTAQTIITACIFNAQVYHSCAFITEIKRRLTLPAYTACIDCVICYDCLQNSAFQMYRQTLHCHHLL